ncbi:spore cortex biosynthesis protein YabQ [Paenibacillus aurantius]|uniref:Spore cortex biosynthesis protein YabQ n=1 Tax=Paenibacillus aurantius TaxID=2918900 RepID=A0AA96RI07_9BACL|nr:spore cortex biosynthesis protein YabQ [Paenibacillus aurantius]WNQ11684.1 spore cortex biosynthesis protein YabQ [Paenibacillus aurantius]
MTLQTQFVTMGMMFLSGLALGVVFDTYRVLTGQLRMPLWLISLFDLVYWAGSTLFVFRMLYYSNQGDLRFYVFLGLAVGVTFHYWFLSRPVIRLVLLLIKLVRWLARMIRRTFELVVVKPIILLYRLVKILAGFVLVLAVFLYRIVIQLLYPIWKLLRWMTSPLWKRLSWPLWMKRWLTRSREWVAGMIRSLFK